MQLPAFLAWLLQRMFFSYINNYEKTDSAIVNQNNPSTCVINNVLSFLPGPTKQLKSHQTHLLHSTSYVNSSAKLMLKHN